MSKFDFDIFSNEEEDALIVNQSEYSLDEAIKIAEVELKSIYPDEYVKQENMEYFKSYIEYGFYTNFDGERINGWHIRSFSKGLEKKRNSVAVWVIKIKEDWSEYESKY